MQHLTAYTVVASTMYANQLSICLIYKATILSVLQMLHLLSTNEASDGGFGHLAYLHLQYLCFSRFFWGLWL